MSILREMPRSYAFHRRLSHLALVFGLLYTMAYLLGWIGMDAEMVLTVGLVVCAWFWAWNRIYWNQPLQSTTAPWLQNTAGMFPMLLLVFSLRSFLYEPFFVPSESMEPTMVRGDVIAVAKWPYGIRIPVLNQWVIGPAMQRGDPVVFRYPVDPNVYFVKRIMAREGDVIVIRNHEVWVNGSRVSETEYATDITKEPDVEAMPFLRAHWPHSCVQADHTTACKVPAGHFFVMGDNRGHSLDSRFWGFVPNDYVMGKATRYVVNTERWSQRSVWGSIR